MNLMRHPNRRVPATKIRRVRPDVVRHHDTDTFTLEHLSRSSALLLFEFSGTRVDLYGLHRALGEMLGVWQEYDA